MSERLRRAATWTVLDQVASTASNTGALFLAAHLGGADALTAFSYAFTAYLFALAVHRALVLTPLLTSPERGPSQVDGTAVALALAFGGVLLVLGTVAGIGLDRPALIAMAVAVPALLLQDAVRFIAFRRRDARRAFLCDATWCLVLLVGVPLAALGGLSGTTITAVWAMGGLVGAIVGLAILRVRPTYGREALLGWWRTLGRFGLGLTADGLMAAFGQQILMLVVVELARADQGIGALRAGQSLVGPLPALFTVLNLLVVPRVAQGDHSVRLLRGMRLIGLGGCALWVSLLLIAKPWIVSTAFADTIPIASLVLIVLGGQALADAFALPIAAEFSAKHRVRALVVSRMIAVGLGIPIAVLYVVRPDVEILAASLLTQAATYAICLAITQRTLRRRSLVPA